MTWYICRVTKNFRIAFKFAKIDYLSNQPMNKHIIPLKEKTKRKMWREVTRMNATADVYTFFFPLLLYLIYLLHLSFLLYQHFHGETHLREMMRYSFSSAFYSALVLENDFYDALKYGSDFFVCRINKAFELQRRYWSLQCPQYRIVQTLHLILKACTVTSYIAKNKLCLHL